METGQHLNALTRSATANETYPFPARYQARGGATLMGIAQEDYWFPWSPIKLYKRDTLGI